MEKEEAQNTVVQFPVQEVDWDQPMSDWQVIQNLRLSAARALNRVNGVWDNLPEAHKQAILGANALCVRNGYRPILIIPASKT